MFTALEIVIPGSIVELNLWKTDVNMFLLVIACHVKLSPKAIITVNSRFNVGGIIDAVIPQEGMPRWSRGEVVALRPTLGSNSA